MIIDSSSILDAFKRKSCPSDRRRQTQRAEAEADSKRLPFPSRVRDKVMIWTLDQSYGWWKEERKYFSF
jgi:hypothetical protein